MKNKHIGVVIGVGCVLGFVMGCGGSDPLRVHFPDGLERVYEVRDRTELEMLMPVLNEGMRQTQRSDSTLRIAVEEPSADGPATMRVTIDDVGVQMSMSFMGEDISFGDGDDNPLAKFAQAVIGEEYRVTVAPDGDIVAFNGFEELLDKVLDAQGVGAFSRSEVAAYMKEMWSADQERLSMQKSVFARLPMTAVDRGTTWTVVYTVTNPLPMSIEDTYTVLNVHDERVTIDVASVISPHPTESSLDFGEFSISMETKGDGEGFIDVDRATGWINEASSTLRIRGECELRGMPMPMPPGMDKIPLVARVEIQSKSI